MGQSGSVPKSSSECCSSPPGQQAEQFQQQQQQQVFPMMMNNNQPMCPNEQFSNCHRAPKICPICSKPIVHQQRPMGNCFFNQMNMNGLYQCMNNPNLSGGCGGGGGMPCWNRNRNNCCANNQQDQPEIKFFYPKCHQTKK